MSHSFPGAGPPAPWRCWNTSVCPCLVPTGSGGKAQGGTQAGVSHLQPRLEASSPSPPTPLPSPAAGWGRGAYPVPEDFTPALAGSSWLVLSYVPCLQGLAVVCHSWWAGAGLPLTSPWPRGTRAQGSGPQCCGWTGSRLAVSLSLPAGQGRCRALLRLLISSTWHGDHGVLFCLKVPEEAASVVCGLFRCTLSAF